MTFDSVPQILIWLIALAAVAAIAFAVGRRTRRQPPPEITEVAPPSRPSDAVQPPQPSDTVPPPQPSISWFNRLSAGLSKTQDQIVRQIESLLTSESEKASREALLDRMLEILVRADVGIRTAEMLVEKVRHQLPGAELSDPVAVKRVLQREILQLFDAAAGAQTSDNHWSLVKQGKKPTVVLMVGVNGVGKTTTTGKIAFKQRQTGRSVIVGAADTFRAAAVDQLEEWARRAGAECVRLSEGSDPASVAFECVKRASAQGTELCLVDTAGRLHNRQDLMQELAKIKRVVSKDVEAAPHEVLLVLDATTGQNALQQAKAFREIAGVTGLVLTKLDGTAKGGVAIALAHEMKLPIRYIGVGESVDDLQEFQAEEFVDALFSNHKAKTADIRSQSVATGSATL
jgi:fused signal recognition particle receptor